MTAEVVSIGSVAIAAIGLAALIIRKHFESSENMRKSLDENTKAIHDHADATRGNREILSELQAYLHRVNGKS